MGHRCEEGEELDREVRGLRERVIYQQGQIDVLTVAVAGLVSVLEPPQSGPGPAVSGQIVATPITSTEPEGTPS